MLDDCNIVYAYCYHVKHTSPVHLKICTLKCHSKCHNRTKLSEHCAIICCVIAPLWLKGISPIFQIITYMASKLLSGGLYNYAWNPDPTA